MKNTTTSQRAVVTVNERPYRTNTVKNNGMAFPVTLSVLERNETGEAVRVVMFAYDEQGKQFATRKSKASIHLDAFQQFMNKVSNLMLEA